MLAQLLLLIMDLRLVFWETTAGCNLRCSYCRRIDVLDSVSHYDLTTEESKKMISQISEFQNVILVFSGGEPLLRKDIFEVIDFAKSRGIIPAIASNGVLIDEFIAREIKRSEVHRVSISIDGAQEKTNDYFRGDGSFKKALQGVDNLKKNNIPVQINFTVTKFNVNELPSVYELSLNMKVDALHIFMLVPVGCGVQVADSQMLSKEEIEQWLNWFADKELENKIELKATCCPQYHRILAQKKIKPVKTKGCLAATGIIFVSHKGDVFPCGYLPLKIGDIKNKTIKEIYNSTVSNVLRNEEFLKGKCGICSFKKICGGCRARAFFAYRDYLQEEPFCNYEPFDLAYNGEDKSSHYKNLPNS